MSSTKNEYVSNERVMKGIHLVSVLELSLCRCTVASFSNRKTMKFYVFSQISQNMQHAWVRAVSLSVTARHIVWPLLLITVPKLRDTKQCRTVNCWHRYPLLPTVTLLPIVTHGYQLSPMLTNCYQLSPMVTYCNLLLRCYLLLHMVTNCHLWLPIVTYCYTVTCFYTWVPTVTYGYLLLTTVTPLPIVTHGYQLSPMVTYC
jgi:hypothetical protein